MAVSGRAPQVPGRVSQSVFDGSRLRAVLLVDLQEGAQQRFLDAYERMCAQVASVPGHISDQLCQSIENPSQWLITSEWESAPPFLAWVNSEEHLETVRPLRACVRTMRPLRFGILRETRGGGHAAAAPGGQTPRPPVRLGDGTVHHALTYTVRPGSESKVAEILSAFDPPDPDVDDATRLLRTSVFLHGDRVVQTVEVRGDLSAALGHAIGRPEVRAVEEALAPHLERERDLGDPQSARVFLTRAAMPAVHRAASGGPKSPRARRHALYYPAREGRGTDLARLIARRDESAANDPHDPVRAVTVFQRDDIVVRMVEVEAEPDSVPVRVLGLGEPGALTEAAGLLDLEALGLDRPPAGERDLLRLLAHAGMRLVTDRRAPHS
ncbi:SchA/CurD-like domain-containing protein [Streptomyces barkulensis]|uniref:SchA/CurD-like domain-containing protein n=1 Tax=Streptomyces barkulensis TaxID=1257026 RepID=UPI001F0F3162|nr:SchA/CurD-like domain-containing protein [Streptomyces barkulensis]